MNTKAQFYRFTLGNGQIRLAVAGSRSAAKNHLTYADKNNIVKTTSTPVMLAKFDRVMSDQSV